MVFIGGLLVDKLGAFYLPILSHEVGLRKSIFLFSLLVTLGALLFCLGPYFNNFWIMVVGRFIFGVGAESAYGLKRYELHLSYCSRSRYNHSDVVSRQRVGNGHGTRWQCWESGISVYVIFYLILLGRIFQLRFLSKYIRYAWELRLGILDRYINILMWNNIPSLWTLCCFSIGGCCIRNIGYAGRILSPKIGGRRDRII